MSLLDDAQAVANALEARFGGAFGVFDRSGGGRTVRRKAGDRRFGPEVDLTAAGLALTVATPVVRWPAWGLGRGSEVLDEQRVDVTGGRARVRLYCNDARLDVHTVEGWWKDPRLAAWRGALVKSHWEGATLRCQLSRADAAGPAREQLDATLLFVDRVLGAYTHEADGEGPPLLVVGPAAAWPEAGGASAVRPVASARDERYARHWVEVDLLTAGTWAGVVTTTERRVWCSLAMPPVAGHLRLESQRGLSGAWASLFEDILRDPPLDDAYVVAEEGGARVGWARAVQAELLALARDGVQLHWSRAALRIVLDVARPGMAFESVGRVFRLWARLLTIVTTPRQRLLTEALDDPIAQAQLETVAAPYGGAVYARGNELVARVHLGGVVDDALQGWLRWDGRRLLLAASIPYTGNELRLSPRGQVPDAPGGLAELFVVEGRGALPAADHVGLWAAVARAKATVVVRDGNLLVRYAPLSSGKLAERAAPGLQLWGQVARALVGLC